MSSLGVVRYGLGDWSHTGAILGAYSVNEKDANDQISHCQFR